MMQEEKDKLLALLDSESKWCQEVDARDDQGAPVHYNDEAAVAWDIVGGMCHLFGWSRACTLFVQLSRHIVGQQHFRMFQDREMVAMGALQDFNDDSDTTYDVVIEKLRDMPVWSQRPSSPV